MIILNIIKSLQKYYQVFIMATEKKKNAYTNIISPKKMWFWGYLIKKFSQHYHSYT